MEKTLVQVIDALYVSIHDYNKQACIFNRQIVKISDEKTANSSG